MHGWCTEQCLQVAGELEAQSQDVVRQEQTQTISRTIVRSGMRLVHDDESHCEKASVSSVYMCMVMQYAVPIVSVRTAIPAWECGT